MVLKGFFIKNFFKISFGSFIAQCLQFFVWLIAVKYYTPEDFGVYAVYTTWLGLLSVVSTGKYEMSIMAAKNRIEAKNLYCVAVSCVILVSLMIFIIGVISNWLGLLCAESIIFVIFPFHLLCSGLQTATQYWFNRIVYFNGIAYMRVQQALVTSILMILLGLNGVTLGLIFSAFCGTVVPLLYIGYCYRQRLINIQGVTIKRLFVMLIKYKNFPKRSMVASLCNTFSATMENLYMPFVFPAASVGNYYFSNRLTGAISTYSAGNIWQVFISKVAGQKKNVILKNVKEYQRWLLCLTMLPFFSMIAMAGQLWNVIFDNRWQDAYVFFVIGSVFVFVNIIVTSFSLFVVLNMPAKELEFNIALFVVKLLGILIAKALSFDLIHTILIADCLLMIVYIYMGCWNYWVLGEKRRYLFYLVGTELKHQVGYVAVMCCGMFFVNAWYQGVLLIAIVNLCYMYKVYKTKNEVIDEIGC